jgi:hypothetical protein
MALLAGAVPLAMLKEQCLQILGRRTWQDSVPNAELPSVAVMAES